MKTRTYSIKNRSGLKLVIQVDKPENPTGLAFVTHGQGGYRSQKHIVAIAGAFLKNGYRVVTFDATHSIGESDGDIIDVTYTSYINDLGDVINWAKQQSWYSEPFALCGHSMGAQSTAWYAEHNPQKVRALIPVAPTINYDLYISTVKPGQKAEWQEKGFVEFESKSRPGVIKRIGWGVNESLKKYDLLANADKLTMPVLDIVGGYDEPCPPDHQKILMDKIGSKNKKLIVIPGVDHNFRYQVGNKIDEVRTEISGWLGSMDIE